MYEKTASFNQIYSNPKYSHIKVSPNKLRRLYNDNLIEVIIDTNGLKKVLIDSLEKYIKKENFIFNNCYTLKETVEKLINDKTKPKHGIKISTYKNHIFTLLDNKILKGKEFDGKTYIFKSSVDEFLKTHISREDAMDQLNATYAILRKIINNNNIESIYISKHDIFYTKAIIEPLIEEYNNKFLKHVTDNNNGTFIKGRVYNTVNYYSADEAKKLLNLTKNQWKSLRIEKDINAENFGGIRHYSKKTVDALKKEQESLRNSYYTSNELKKTLNLKTVSTHSEIMNTRIKTPILFRGLVQNEITRYVYPKNVVDKFSKEKELKKTLLTFNDPVDAFKYQIKNSKIIFSEDNPFTTDQWLSYVYNYLNNTNTNSNTIHYLVTRFIKCTKIIVHGITNKELYNMTSNQINLVLFNKNIPVTYQKIFYSFISSIYDNLIYQKKLFKIGQIINPFQNIDSKTDKSIYEYETYKLLFEYATDITYHKKRAIADAEKQIRQHPYNQGIPCHDSSWLYILIHLNNAWRHNDVIKFPRIDLSVLDIPNIDLKWLTNNNISYEDAQKIIHQIMHLDLKTSKTNATNYFFCSNDVLIPIATAAIICELRRLNRTPDYEYLINFYSIRNEFSLRHSNRFFKDFPDNFKFENRKMNRTLLSFTYHLLIKKGHITAALQVAQRLRAHFDFETTNIYIFIPEDELDNLTHQLFIRGSFGYIPDLLAEVLYGNQNTFEKRTKEIVDLKKAFGSIYNIENTAGFLNSIQAERKKVSEMIINMGFEEATNYMFKLNAQLLPSKEINVQCLIGVENCNKHHLSCMNCPMAIPNIYALSSLSKSLLNRIDVLTNLDYEENTAEKTKTANFFLIEMDQWKRAIDKFGKQSVYQFIDGGSEFLKEKLRKISTETVNQYQTINNNSKE